MPASKRSLWDHYLDAVALLRRADVHLEFLINDLEYMAGKAGCDTIRLETTEKLRAEVQAYLKKKVPTQ